MEPPTLLRSRFARATDGQARFELVIPSLPWTCFACALFILRPACAGLGTELGRHLLSYQLSILNY